jgi:acetyl/propionyl-CoA carboxylase alpha subunit
VTVWLELEGKQLRLELPKDASGGALKCVVEDRPVEVDARVMEAGVISLLVDGRQYRCVLDGDAVIIGGRRFGFAVEDPRSLRGRRGVGEGAAGPRAVKAPMPGRVVRVLVSEGDQVTEHQGVVVIEAMKMQNELRSPRDGTIGRTGIAVGETVEIGDLLVVIE